MISPAVHWLINTNQHVDELCISIIFFYALFFFNALHSVYCYYITVPTTFINKLYETVIHSETQHLKLVRRAMVLCDIDNA